MGGHCDLSLPPVCDVFVFLVLYQTTSSHVECHVASLLIIYIYIFVVDNLSNGNNLAGAVPEKHYFVYSPLIRSRGTACYARTRLILFPPCCLM